MTPSIKKSTPGTKIDPKQDGVAFINVDTNAVSMLGRQLAPFAKTRFVHPFYGPFQSLVGYTLWLSTGRTQSIDELRYLRGKEAQARAKALPTVRYEQYWQDVKVGHWLKVKANRRLEQDLKQSTLPFEAYYIYGPANIVVETMYRDFLIQTLSEIREALLLGPDAEPEFYVAALRRYQQDCTDGPLGSASA